MKFGSRTIRAAAAAGALSALAACGHKDNQQAAGDVAVPAATGVPAATPSTVAIDSTTPDHHSKLGGALVGAAAGHMLGGHAVAGAAVGALVQHERNKHQKP